MDTDQTKRKSRNFFVLFLICVHLRLSVAEIISRFLHLLLENWSPKNSHQNSGIWDTP